MQLAAQVRHAVEVGGLAPGEKLPTVRGLAEELAIAPNTIVKAYNELQREGLVDAAALGITEDDLWESLDSEFERIPRERGEGG